MQPIRVTPQSISGQLSICSTKYTGSDFRFCHVSELFEIASATHLAYHGPALDSIQCLVSKYSMSQNISVVKSSGLVTLAAVEFRESDTRIRIGNGASPD